MRTKIVNLHIVFLLGIFPLLMHDGFFDISITKSYIYILATASVFLFCIVSSIWKKDWTWMLKKRNWLIYVAGFLIWINTKYAWSSTYALTGEAGRYQGAYVYWAYCVGALCILNFGSFREYFFGVAITSGACTGIIAILNFYEVDVLNTISQLSEGQRHLYISTIGNTNIYSAYLSIITPIALIRAIMEEDRKKRILYNLASMCLFGAMIASRCDSVYITLLILAGFVPFYAFPYANRRIRMLVQFVLLTSVLLGMNLLNHRLMYPLGYVDGISRHFLDTNLCVALFVISVCLAAGCCFFEKRLESITVKQWRISWFCIAGIGFLAGAFFYITHTVFDGNWGSYRGFIWMQGIDFYIKQPFLQKCLGIGLDSVYPVFYAFYGHDGMLVDGFAHYDNLHNEYLQYLVTTGIAGLGLYLVIMGCLFCHLFQNAKHDKSVIAIGLAGVCYMAQAFVNISMSSVTPIILMLLLAGQVINTNLKERNAKK